jgi:Family of unknown function (DUF6527)
VDRSQNGRKTAASRLRVQRVEEFPDVPAPGVLYAVGEGPHIWFAGMLCPCGCGDFLKLSLLEESRSFWTLVIHRNGSATLWPSVVREVGCKSHFNLRRGRIEWWVSNDY